MKLYDDYIEAKANLDHWKKRELDLRMKVCEEQLKEKSVGTHHFTKHNKNGYYKGKAVKKVNYKLDSEMLAAIWNDMSEDEQSAIKMEPKLLVKEYKSVDNTEMLDHAITVVPAMPTLTIEYVTEGD